jgi:rubrerythrin
MGTEPVRGDRHRERVKHTMRDEKDDFVEFQEAGDPAKGQYRCSGCGYGVTVHDELPTCPMCAGTSWEQSAWSPFGNARSLQGARGTSAVL